MLLPIQIFTNASMAGDLTSAGIHVQLEDNMGVQFVWTGTPTGTFGINVSNTAILNPTGTVSGGTWTPLVLTNPQAPVASGSAGNGFIDLNQTGAAFIQVTYIRGSGTGTLNAYLAGKSV